MNINQTSNSQSESDYDFELTKEIEDISNKTVAGLLKRSDNAIFKNNQKDRGPSEENLKRLDALKTDAKKFATDIEKYQELVKQALLSDDQGEQEEWFLVLSKVNSKVGNILPHDSYCKLKHPLEVEVEEMVRRAEADEELVPRYQRRVHNDPAKYLEKYFGKYLKLYNDLNRNFIYLDQLRVIAGTRYIDILRKFVVAHEKVLGVNSLNQAIETRNDRFAKMRK